MLNLFIYTINLLVTLTAYPTTPCQGQRQAYIEGKVTQVVRIEGLQEPQCLAFSNQFKLLQNRMCPVIVEQLQFGIPVSCDTPLNSNLTGLVIINERESIIQFKQFSYRYPEILTPSQPIPELGIQ